MEETKFKTPRKSSKKSLSDKEIRNVNKQKESKVVYVKKPEDKKIETILDQGLELAQELEHLPTWAEWVKHRKKKPELYSEWQIYRCFGGSTGAWNLFHYMLLEKLEELKC